MTSATLLISGGLILAADYSQLELRILAHLSCDCRLIQALNGGTDVFKSIAAEWKMIDPEAVGDGTRQQAKQVIFKKRTSTAAFWAGRLSVQNIRESQQYGLLFEFVCDGSVVACMTSHSQYISAGAVWVLRDEGGKKQHEWLGLRGSLSS